VLSELRRTKSDANACRKHVHALSTLLAALPSKVQSSLLAQVQASLSDDVVPALSTLAATTSRYDQLLALSCLTNLAHLGKAVTCQLGEEMSVRMSVLAALQAASDDAALRQYALPCAYNLSDNAAMLHQLIGEPSVARSLQSFCAQADTSSMHHYAQGVLRNMKRHAHLQQCRGNKPYPADRRGKRLRAFSGAAEQQQKPPQCVRV